MQLLQDVDLKNQRVLLRVDFNVPIKDGEITDVNRIKAVLPTIKFLVESRAKIIIGTHLGRPEGKRSEETSIAPVAKELQRMLNLKVVMAPDILGEEVEKLVSALQPGGILVLENLRWDKREEENDPEFAKLLASYADIYINDAFAVSHRANASVEAITDYLPSYAGILLQSEVTNLELLMNEPKKPFVLVIGGVKVKDKAGVIDKLADKTESILIGGGVANTFLKARGEDIGASVYDEEMVEETKEMLAKYGDKIHLPDDTIKEQMPDGKFQIMDIGPITQQNFSSIIRKAETVFWNGNLGYSEDPRYREGMRAVARAMSYNQGTTVIAGGDTVGFAKSEGLDKGISFISTGGGAALEFLAGEKLPGLSALN